MPWFAMNAAADNPQAIARKNIRRYIAFRVFFNARFYYPVFAILFLEFGLTLSQFALLNVVWAVTIVVLEVPSGALADVIGRKRLLVFAGGVMVLEIAILCFAPRSRPDLLFVLFLINRILSGVAEASASGADEALAYDSLVAAGEAGRWTGVLSTLMRVRSVSFVAAMTVGAAVYDPAIMQRVAAWLNLPWRLGQDVTLRFPLYLTFIMALLAFGATLGMKEVGLAADEKGGAAENKRSVGLALRKTLEAGKWVWTTPFALVVIMAGMLFDHVIRMLTTMNSQYFRLIDLPEAVFGIIGAGFAGLGLIAPALAQYLVGRRTPRFVLLFQAVFALLGLLGLTFFVPYAGLLPMGVLVLAWFINNFAASHYLNRITSSERRATVLSFRGLSFNLAYGLIGILYSVLLAKLQAGHPNLEGSALENQVFIDAMAWFPWYFMAVLAGLCLAAAWLLKGRDEHRSMGR